MQNSVNKQTLLAVLIFQFVWLFSPWARADYVPPNFNFSGKTIAEKQVQWAWWVLPSFLKACQYSSDCGLSDVQMNLLKRIVANLPFYNGDTIQFKSEKANPGLYRSDAGEIHRVAVTGLDPHAPVNINTDILDTDRSFRAIPLWMGFLSHEMVHHLGIADDAQRIPDQFGAAITKAAESLLVPWTVSKGKTPIEVFVLNYPLPRTAEFFQDFPQGVFPAPIFVDSAELYNISNLNEILTPAMKPCGTEPMLGVRVSPLTEKYRPSTKPGIQSGTLTYDAQGFCFNSKTNQAESVHKTFVEQFDFTEGAAGTVLIEDSFISTFDATVDSTVGSETRLEWLSGKLAADQIKAGQTLTWTAQVRDLGMGVEVKACGARLSRPNWEKMRLGVPLSVYHDTCRIVSHQGDVYSLEMTRKIPADAAPGPMSVDSVCLSRGDVNEDGCYVATPPRPLAFQILNSPQPVLKLVQARISNATPLKPMPGVSRYYYIQKGQRFTLTLDIDGASDLLDAFLEGELVTDQDKMGSFTGPLLNNSQMFVKAIRTRKTATGISIDFDIEPFTDFQGMTIKLLKFWRLSLISENLQTAIMDFKDYDFAVMFEDYVPKEYR